MNTTPVAGTSGPSTAGSGPSAAPVTIRTLRRPAWRAVLLLAPGVAFALLGACVDDAGGGASAANAAESSIPPDSADAASAGDPELIDYCALAEELNEQDELPNSAQLAAYAALAPETIAIQTEKVTASIEAADGDFTALFADDEAMAALDEITAFEAETCGFEPPEEPQDPSVTELDPNATQIDVAATDYHFAAQFPTRAGRFSFVMDNRGAEPHMLILAHLEEGVTIEEVLASEGETGVVATFESDVAMPGQQVVVTADLDPGRWVVVCPIPNSEGTPHEKLGMLHDFSVS